MGQEPKLGKLLEQFFFSSLNITRIDACATL